MTSFGKWAPLKLIIGFFNYEATSRIKINKLLEVAVWRFFVNK
jgi:hypothetical protein